ncbi:hypothetical protein KP509_01G084900 [Ceratopteris richardii]|uniref:Uncharacterized protein n=1 Tax=Ceratopteris richardii TaxID=49495 RepID=A0A8T2VML1_CERRI|nr:hypothetical protein KP509_01G084900 [Ceratopteris richardii]
MSGEKDRALQHTQNDIFLGLDPSTSREIWIKIGPFGRQIHLGKDRVQGVQSSIVPENLLTDDITLEKALELMQYPKELGKHPDDGYPVILDMTRKSFVLKHQSASVALSEKETLEEISLEAAINLLTCERRMNVEKHKLPIIKRKRAIKQNAKSTTNALESENFSANEM